MRCKKHFSVDVSSAVGVCASCLRERLCSLIGAEPRAYQSEDRRNSDQKLPHCRRRHQPPSPLVLPRSVSPYISHRKSDPSDAVDYNHRSNLQEIRFFSTPQADPIAKTTTKKKSKLHAISNLFRSRSAKSAPPPASDPFSDPAFSVSGFIFPAAGRRKKTALRLFSLNQASSVFDGHRGMSPDVLGEDDSDAESLSPVRFGCSPEPWRKTPSSGHGPTTRASHVRVKASPARGHVASGIGICLSPLMRPSPIRHWSGKGVVPGGGAVEAVYSGEVRSTVKPHLSNAASFCSNRSRKLADFGKFNHNR